MASHPAAARERIMSQTTPFIAKITMSSSVGPYTDRWGYTRFLLYDTTGGTCVMRAQPIQTSGAVTIPLCHNAGAAGTLFNWVDFDPATGPVTTFVYTLSGLNFLHVNLTLAPNPLSIYQNHQIFPQPPFLGTVTPLWLGTALGQNTDCGLTITVITPGAKALLPAGNPDSFWYPVQNFMDQPIVLDFDWVDLSGEDYSSAVLFIYVLNISPTFRHANLTNTSFAGNTINNATFDHASLDGTNFRGATLSQSTFFAAAGTGPDFSGATFNSGVDFSNASLPGADFSGANFAATNFSGCNLTGAKFNGASLQGVVFDHAILAGADFSNAQLQGTRFTNTDVMQAIFSPNAAFSTSITNRTSFAGSVVPAELNGGNWSYLDLSGAKLSPTPSTITNLNAQSACLFGLDLSNISFVTPTNFANALLAQTNFSNSDLSGAVFTSAVAEPDPDPSSPYRTSATFSGANLQDVQFNQAALSGADFSLALLWGGQATLDGATLTDADFSNAFLGSAQFTALRDAQCAGVIFDGAWLVNAKFKNTALQAGGKGSPVSFVGAFLQGANFCGATLSAVNLSGAVLATESASVTPNFNTNPPGTIPGGAINYPPTILDPSQTSVGTVCVNGQTGPCTASSNAPPNPMPSTWNQGSAG
jgi:uncharacterized protein YjbI with pentapeptide repeats